jgi:hypothetical protein
LSHQTASNDLPKEFRLVGAEGNLGQLFVLGDFRFYVHRCSPRRLNQTKLMGAEGDLGQFFVLGDFRFYVHGFSPKDMNGWIKWWRVSLWHLISFVAANGMLQ